MPNPLSDDFQQAVVEVMSTETISDREIARRFEISPSSAGLIRKRLARGELAPKGAIPARVAALEEEVAGILDVLRLMSTRVRDLKNVINRELGDREWIRHANDDRQNGAT